MIFSRWSRCVAAFLGFSFFLRRAFKRKRWRAIRTFENATH
jgi:hypothetical protein